MGINFINEFIVNSNQIDANIRCLRRMEALQKLSKNWG